MRGAQEYTIEYLKGLERDGNPTPRDRDPRSAYLARNVRIGHTQGAADKLPGRSKIYNSSLPAGATRPGHILGLTEARIAGSDIFCGVISTNDLTVQQFGTVTYSGGPPPAWSFNEKHPAGFANFACPVNRRFSFAVLNNLLIISDHGVSVLKQFDGNADITSLTVVNGPEYARYLITVRDYMFAAYTRDTGAANLFPYRIRWCDAGNPNAWTATNYWDLTARSTAIATVTESDAITGLGAIQDLVVGFKRDSIHVGAFTSQPPYFFFETIVPDKGNLSPFAIVPIGNMLTFVWKDGIYVFDGSPIPRKISGKKISHHLVTGLKEANLWQIWASKHPFKPEVWFCTQEDSYPTWIYNYETDDWFQSSLNYECLGIARRIVRLTWNDLLTDPRYTWDSVRFKDGDRTWDKAFNSTVSEEIMMGGGTSEVGTDQAILYEVDSGVYQDVGQGGNTAVMTATWRSQPTDCGLPNKMKRVLGATVKVAPLAATLTVRLYVDGTQAGGNVSATVAFSGADYDEITVYFNAVGVSFQLEIENAIATESFRILGVSLNYIPREDIR